MAESRFGLLIQQADSSAVAARPGECLMSASKSTKRAAIEEIAEAPDGKLKGKDYLRELARLHVELVKLQQWVVH